MRRVPALLAALSVAATGCSFSSVDPEATISISGRALDASGRPLADARVLLVKQSDIGEVVFGAIFTLGSLGAICLAPEPPTICRKTSVATTDADGRYEFEVEGSDTQGTLGTESTLSVVFAGSEGEGSTALSFTAGDTEITLPDAGLWRSRPRVSVDPEQIDVSWAALPASAGTDAEYSAQVLGARDQLLLWSQPTSGGQAAIDPRIIEDRPGSVAVGATTGLSGGSGAGEVRATYSSRRLPVEATAGAPPSRGRPCAAVTGTGPVGGGRLSACPVTDGDLAAPARLSAPRARLVTGVVIDLGSSRPVDLVVVRGFADQFLVEVSTDGREFTPVGTQSGTAVAFSPPDRPSARYVRLRSPTGLDQSLAAEVSVW